MTARQLHIARSPNAASTRSRASHREIDHDAVQAAARALLRGVQKQGVKTVTSALHGLVRDSARTRHELLVLTREETP